MKEKNLLNVAVAQMSPIWLNKEATISKVKDYINDAAKKKVELLVFGEALLPGYPFWIDLTGGAEFNSPVQKEIHAHYINNAIQIEAGDLDGTCQLAKQNNMAIYLGIVERPIDRGGHSLYCSMVYINQAGEIKSVHRKLQPTYEERLTWSPGDGNGLRVHTLNDFTVGGLNCWENWMPLPRAALYGMGEDLHVAIWPGSIRNTEDITRFMAKEARSFVISSSALMHKTDIPKDLPHYDKIVENAPDELTDGGSCIAAPDGSWIIEPIVNQEGVFTATIDHQKVLEERQNFDPVGHYSRPDVTKLYVNRERQSTINLDMKHE